MTLPTQPGRLAILVIEDEAPNRALLRAVLSRAPDERLRGADVLEAATLDAARTILTERRVDLVLLDVRLPDGSGLELAAELQAADAQPRPHILILSASVLPAEREAALRSGVDGFLGKPYRPADLVTAVRRALGLDGGPSPAG